MNYAIHSEYYTLYTFLRSPCLKNRGPQKVSARTGKLEVTNFQFLDEKMIDRRESLVYYQAAKYHCTIYEFGEINEGEEKLNEKLRKEREPTCIVSNE